MRSTRTGVVAVVLLVLLAIAGCESANKAGPGSTPSSRSHQATAAATPLPAASPGATTLPGTNIPVRPQGLTLSGTVAGRVDSAEVFRCGLSADQTLSISLSSIRLGDDTVSISLTVPGYSAGNSMSLAAASGTILAFGVDQRAHIYRVSGGTITSDAGARRGVVDAAFVGSEDPSLRIQMSGSWSCA